MPIRRIFIWTCAVFLFAPVLSHAQSNNPNGKMSTSELLDYALKDLNEGIEKIKGQNSIQEQKNKALRARFQTLKDHIEKLQDDEIKLQKENAQLREMVRIQKKEAGLHGKKLSGQGASDGRLQEEQKILKESIARARQKEKPMKKAARILEDEIRDLDGRLQKAELASQSSKNKEIIDNYKMLIGESGLRKQELENQILFSRTEKEKIVSGKNEKGAEYRALQEKERQLQETLNVQRDRTSVLQKEAGRYHSDQAEKVEAVSRMNSELENYQTRLEEEIGRMQDLKSKIASGFTDQAKELNRWLQLLTKENQLLNQRVSALEDMSGRIKSFSEDMEKIKTAETSTGTEAEAKEKLQKTIEDLKNKLKAQETLAKDKSKKKTDLEKAISDMNEQFAKSQKTLGMKKNDLIARKKKTLGQEIKNFEHEKLMKVKQVSAGEQSLAEALEKEKWIKETKGQLEQKVTAYENQIKELAFRQDELERRGIDMGSPNEDAIKETKAIIDALKMKESILENSLSVIETKYGGEQASNEEITKESQDLIHYLSMMQEENTSLQKQVLTVEMQIERLQKNR